MLHSNQFHLDGKNQGFVPIRTLTAIDPKWILEVGPVGYGTPVIGPDGVIYIGTLSGDLVAVDPNGKIRWRRRLVSREVRYPGAVTGSPAVGLDNHIYVVTTVNVTIREHRNGEQSIKRTRRSSLHRISPEGDITWTYQFPKNASPRGFGGYTFSSPKVWGNPPFIFVPSIYYTSGHAIELLVIDQDGRAMFRTDIASYPPGPITGSGPGIGDILGAIWDFISSPVDFDTSGIDNGSLTLQEKYGLPEPTAAIVDYNNNQQPFVVYEDAYKTLTVFRFEPPVLVPLWKKVSDKARFRSAPAAFPNGVIVLGDHNGTISQYVLENGNEIAKPWFKADKGVISPVASFGRQIYFVADDTVYVLDSDSELWKKHHPIGKTLAAPALSANHLYISAVDGLYTFSFDLADFSKNSDVKGGVSSPVISDDGTVYVMDVDKHLWAFG